MTLVARAPRPTDGWAVTTGPCGRPVGVSLSSGSGETPRQCGPDSGHDTRATPRARWESQTLRGKINETYAVLERLTFQIVTAISFNDSGSQIRAVYGKGARPARRAVECAAMGPGHAPPHTRTRQPRSEDAKTQVPAEQLLCCRVYRVLALSPIL